MKIAESVVRVYKCNLINKANASVEPYGTNKITKGGENIDKACNIYDLSINCWEWTTEKTTAGKFVARGSNTTSKRTALSGTEAYSMSSFRQILYLK